MPVLTLHLPFQSYNFYFFPSFSRFTTSLFQSFLSLSLLTPSNLFFPSHFLLLVLPFALPFPFLAPARPRLAPRTRLLNWPSYLAFFLYTQMRRYPSLVSYTTKTVKWTTIIYSNGTNTGSISWDSLEESVDPWFPTSCRLSLILILWKNK